MNLTVTAQAAPNNEKTFLIHRLHRLNGLKPKNPSLLICGNLRNLWIKDLFFTPTSIIRRKGAKKSPQAYAQHLPLTLWVRP